MMWSVMVIAMPFAEGNEGLFGTSKPTRTWECGDRFPSLGRFEWVIGPFWALKCRRFGRAPSDLAHPGPPLVSVGLCVRVGVCVHWAFPLRWWGGGGEASLWDSGAMFPAGLRGSPLHASGRIARGTGAGGVAPEPQS